MLDETGKSIPAAEAMVDAENNSSKPHPNEFCLNCGTQLQDRYCHHCGQRDIPKRQTLGDMFSNFISSFWSYEGKFFTTTRHLFLRPGYLVKEYNSGKRETYFHPARMYVFVSFLFFLVFFSLPDEDKKELADLQFSETDKKALAKKGLDSKFRYSDSVLRANNSPEEYDSIKKAKRNKGNVSWNLDEYLEYKSVAEWDSVQNTLPEEKRAGWFSRIFAHRGIELNLKYHQDWDALTKDFKQAYNDNFSKVLFWLLPFFALVLKLLYVRRDFYYSEHLVMTIYYYDFVYITATAVLLLDLVPWLSWLSTILSFWIYFYLLFAMKRVYGQRWGKTILKFFVFSFLFMMLLMIGLTISAFATLMAI